MHENEISRIVVNCAFQIHTTLGPGLLESVYQTALAYELSQAGLRVIVEKPIPAIYKTIQLEVGFRADLMVENKVIVETKSVDAIAPVHTKVLLTYLRLADKKLGLLINFNVDLIKNGIKRVVNNLQKTSCTESANPLVLLRSLRLCGKLFLYEVHKRIRHQSHARASLFIPPVTRCV